MGLDVYLCQFKDRSADAILALSQFVDEWNAIPSSERGSFEKVTCRSKALGLPEKTAVAYYFGGTGISFPSKRQPRFLVGEWSSFSLTRELIEDFTGKNFYFVFPEAKGNPRFLRPDWAASRKRLVIILESLQKLKQKQIENFHGEFVMPHVPQSLLEKVKPSQLASASEIFENQLAQIEVMIETLDFVLNHAHPREFLLRWSA